MFLKNCRYMASKVDYMPYEMNYTMLTDFSDDDLNGMMNVTQKHSGRGAYYPYVPVERDAVEPVFTMMERDFCSEDAELREYVQPSNCSFLGDDDRQCG